MEQQEQHEAAPRLCSKGCGFFSNAATNGMCSKCWKDEQAAEDKAKAALAAAQEVPAPVEAPAAAAPAPAPAAAEAEPMAPDLTPAPASAAAEASSSPPAPAAEEAGPASPSSACKPNRCQTCRKKVGLTGFSCKCGQLFCGTHRYAEAHACTYDYRAEGREKLAANNPLVTASKLERI